MVELPHFKRLVIAAYRLPFKFSESKKGLKATQNSGGLVSAILSLSENFRKTTNRGFSMKIVWAGIADNLPENLPTQNISNENFELLPVHLSKHLNDLYYGGFCNDLVWPLFHYFPSYSLFNDQFFKAYEEANGKFCEELVKIIKPGDFIWIHDYQLMLLPRMIQKILPDTAIGFFLHIPFPSFELFRLMPRKWRESIINGLLGADLIGFHTHDYAQHFIKSVKRTTGFECRNNIIYTHNKLVKADAFPIGIDYVKFNEACLNKKVLIEKQKIKDHLSTQKLIFSVDRLDYTKGLLLRLKGFETFLEKYPKWHSKVIFNMVVVPSRIIVEKYREMKKEVESTVGRINGKYSTLGWRPIIYQYKSLSFNEMVALYDLSDVGLITPLRDGMNLVAKEYVACQIENEGVLILSEMTGAAAELNEALIINPADNNEMADSIFKALEMDPTEKHERLQRMQNRLSSYNVYTWAYDFFNQTSEIKKEQSLTNVRLITDSLANKIIKDYNNASTRILFLDYDGTLVSFTKYPELTSLDSSTVEIIRKLANDPNNQIVIISGRSKDFLAKEFLGIDVVIVAEHGYFIKFPGKDWEISVEPGVEWKKTILPILNEYVSRCNGTFIEEKEGSIAWHYRNADTDFAQLRLHELRDDLTEIIRHKTDFEILEGNKVLEVKSGKYDKGKAARSIMKNKHFDFVLAAGDDRTDESLFRQLNSSAYTIRVGLSPSIARFNISDFNLLVKLLNDLAH
jgi:trehalose 6-phosphate synthase/phosphatase